MPLPPTENSPRGESNPQRVEALFHQASELAPAVRSVFLDRECGDDVALRRTLERLLASSADAENNPGWSEPAILKVARASADAADPEVDRYRLLERIGVGGMGVVYRAVRSDDTFSKEVAIKIVHWAAGDEEILRRFRAERQMLASLEHPNIARLLDGGIADDGSPFLVMEFVRGLAIDRYVVDRKPPLQALLEMFRRICSAVGYAHRNLIVHRDLKPGNILVTDGPDGNPEPKLLDFGIARLLDDSGHQTRTRAMTLEYASPEQVSGAPISTASDIYSLGVMLYELVSGNRPYRVTTSEMDLAEAICREAPRSMGAGVDADLANIILMALRKEPARRYESAEQFSEDLRRFLDGYPVVARPDTRTYRARKFVGRNRLLIAGAALVAMTLAGGVFATVRQSRIATRRFNDVRSLANYFVADVHDAIKELPGALPVRKIIVGKSLEYLDSLARDQGDDRELQGEIAAAYEKIASVQGGMFSPSNLGDHAGALASYRKAAVIRERLVAAYPKDVTVLRELAECYSSMGSTQAQSLGDLKNGVALLRKAVGFGERAVAVVNPPDKEAQNILADSLLMLGDAVGNSSYQNLGDAKGAADLYRKALTIRERLANAAQSDKGLQMNLAQAENRLGMILNSQGDLTGALVPLRRVREIDESALAADPHNVSTLINTGSANRNLAIVMSRAGQRKEALPFAERAGEIYQQVVREDPGNAGAKRSLASNYYAIGSLMDDDTKAIELFDASIEGFRNIQKEHPGSAPEVGWRTALQYRSEAENRLGNTAQAMESAQQIKAITEELLKVSPDNFTARDDLYLSYSLLGAAYETLGRKTGDEAALRQAGSWFRQAVDGYSKLDQKALSRSGRQAFAKSTEALARLRAAR